MTSDVLPEQANTAFRAGQGADQIRETLLLAEDDVDDQLLSFDFDDVTESSFATPSEIECDATLANTQVANMEVIEPGRENRRHDVEFAARSTGANAEQGIENQEEGS